MSDETISGPSAEGSPQETVKGRRLGVLLCVASAIATVAAVVLIATTMISAIRSSGVIRQASIVFDGPTDAMIFRGYVQQCLSPALNAGDIVVMDNLSSHKVTGVREAIELKGSPVASFPTREKTCVDPMDSRA